MVTPTQCDTHSNVKILYFIDKDTIKSIDATLPNDDYILR